MDKSAWYAVGLGAAGLVAIWLLGTSSPVRFDASKRPVLQTQSVQTPVTILAGGDVNMGRLIGKKILAGDINYPFANISDTLKDADITFVNLESQLADLGGETQSPTNEYRFAGPPQAAQSLKNAGIDMVSVANNHMWDYGFARLQETWQSLSDAGVGFVGSTPDGTERCSGAPMEIKGKKIEFFAITLLLNGYETTDAPNHICYVRDIDKLISQIKMVRDHTDWILVSVHGGVEYQVKPTQQQIDVNHQLIDAGADVILGGHPHVPEPIEKYNGKLIFYSLGNFAFWQPFSFWTQHSFLAKLTLGKDDIKYEVVPVSAGWQPSLLTDSASVDKLNQLLNSKVSTK